MNHINVTLQWIKLCVSNSNWIHTNSQNLEYIEMHYTVKMSSIWSQLPLKSFRPNQTSTWNKCFILCTVFEASRKCLGRTVSCFNIYRVAFWATSKTNTFPLYLSLISVVCVNRICGWYQELSWLWRHHWLGPLFNLKNVLFVKVEHLCIIKRLLTDKLDWHLSQ